MTAPRFVDRLREQQAARAISAGGDAPDWNVEGRDWPLRETSRFVEAGGLRWHVQVAGGGPGALMLHGTGAATHSWRDLCPLLGQRLTVVAPDLPGHGFTSTPPPESLSLPGMAAGLGSLVRALAVEPAIAVGHSAGAAVLIRMTLDGLISPRVIVSLNGALLPLGGFPGRIFSPLAKLLAWTGLVPQLFAWRADDPAVIGRLLEDTGSRLDARGTELYARLARRPGHIAGAFGMMANWDLRPLERDLPRLRSELVLVVGASDGTIPPSEAQRVAAIVPRARVIRLPGLGHLAHEERPDAVAALIVEAARGGGVLPAG